MGFPQRQQAARPQRPLLAEDPHQVPGHGREGRLPAGIPWTALGWCTRGQCTHLLQPFHRSTQSTPAQSNTT